MGAMLLSRHFLFALMLSLTDHPGVCTFDGVARSNAWCCHANVLPCTCC